MYLSAAPWLNRRGITDLEGQVGRSGRPLKEVLKQTVNHAQAIRDGRPTTVLMDPAHLPRPVRLGACISRACGGTGLHVMRPGKSVELLIDQDCRVHVEDTHAGLSQVLQPCAPHPHTHAVFPLLLV